MANQLHDLTDLLHDALGVTAPDPSPPTPAAPYAHVTPDGWPVEPADVFVLDTDGPIAVCTLGDPDLARSLAAGDRPRVALVGPMATENLGVEKLVRNVVTNPAITTIVIVGPETGGSAPTGHYAGDALLCLLENGVESPSMRIVGARGRRPFVKNLTSDEVGRFRRQIVALDHRGELDPNTIAALLDAVDASAPRSAVPDGHPAPGDPRAGPGDATSGSAGTWVEAPELGPSYQEDPAGYFVVFCDHAGGRLVVEHYSTGDERTLVIAGREPRSIVRVAIERGLLTTLEHAAYLGRELERALAALRAGRVYVQDGEQG